MPTAPPEKRMPRKLTPKTPLGKRLLAYIEAKGYSSTREAAIASGINYQQLYDLVSGKRDDVMLSTLERIITGMGGTMAEFFLLDAEKISK